PAWKDIAEGDSFRVAAETARSGTDRRAMLGMLPLRDDAGHFIGAISIAIDVGWLDFVVRSSPLPRGSVVAIFDRYGRVLASKRPLCNPARATGSACGVPDARKRAFGNGRFRSGP